MRTLLVSLAAIVLLAACKKSETVNNTVTAVITVNNLIADTIIGITPIGQPYGSGKYTLFSIENNTIISNIDSATTKWDIGFRGTNIITNSGNSGPGNGGAFIQVGAFDDFKTISNDSTFKVDNAPTSYAITYGSNKGWYVYNGATNLITAIPGRILVVRTANNKFAKIEILNYYKGGVTPASTASDAVKLSEQRYYTFRYQYQSNGTKQFQ